MRVKYQEFLAKYESSGLNMTEFGRQEGMSSSMVGYYVKRARQEQGGEAFVKLKVSQDKPFDRQITIRTRGGLEIQIPI